MTNIEKLTKEIKSLQTEKEAVSENLKALQDERLNLQAEIGAKLIENKSTSTKALDDLQADIQRQELAWQAYERRISQLESERTSAINEKLKVELDGMEKTSEDMLLEMAKTIESLHKQAVAWLELRDDYHKQAGKTVDKQAIISDRYGWLRDNGIPVVVVLNTTDAWLTNTTIANVAFQEKLKEAGILTQNERSRARANSGRRYA